MEGTAVEIFPKISAQLALIPFPFARWDFLSRGKEL